MPSCYLLRREREATGKTIIAAGSKDGARDAGEDFVIVTPH